MSYNKKSTREGKRKLGSHLENLYNPFSVKYLNPKWPDGNIDYSYGQQHVSRNITEGKNQLHFFYPGLIGHVTSYILPNADANGIYAEGTTQNAVACHLSQDYYLFPLQSNLVTNTVDPTNTIQHWYIYQNSTDTLVNWYSWRPVSFGLKFYLYSADDDNDGWFEAIRTTNKDMYNLSFYADTQEEPGTTTFSTVSREGSPTMSQGAFGPTTDTFDEWCKTKDWTLNPSYCNGKLKDIHKYNFQLNPIGGDNSPIIAEPTKTFTSSFLRKNSISGNFTRNEFMPENIDAPDAAAQILPEYKNLTVYSHNFDCIVIRVHGIAQTKLLSKAVANFEFANKRFFSTKQYTPCTRDIDGLAAFVKYREKHGKLAYDS